MTSHWLKMTTFDDSPDSINSPSNSFISSSFGEMFVSLSSKNVLPQSMRRLVTHAKMRRRSTSLRYFFWSRRASVAWLSA